MDTRCWGAPAGLVLSGRWRLDEVVGSGSAAVVWRARDLRDDRDVAIKLLHADPVRATHLGETLEREARWLSEVRHPRVVSILDGPLHDDPHTFLVLELARQGCLARTAQQVVLGVGALLGIAADVLEALEAIHAVGLVHRDVKPGNVLLADDGSACLADFGVASLSGHEATPAGTPWFASPEQSCQAVASPSADLFALGATLFAVATSRSPVELFVAAWRGEALEAVPEPLRHVVDRATAWRPAERYADAAEVRADVLAARLALG